MGWLKQEVWQLGIGVLLIVAGAVLIYIAAADDVNESLLWVGIVLAWLGLLVPLFAKLYESMTEQQSEESEA